MHILQPLPGTLQKTGHLLADSIALWPMNSLSDSIFDASGHGHIGQLINAINWTSAGRCGFALNLAGVNGFVTIASHPDFTPALTPFSISAWINLRDRSNFVIASKGVLFTNGEWLFALTATGKLFLTLLDESVANGYIGRIYDTPLTENQWLHVLCTYDGGILSNGIRLYLNGVRVDDTDNTGAGVFVSVEFLGQPVRIGMHNASMSDGLMDNVIIWRRELPDYDAALLYREQSCMFPENIMPEFGLVA